LVRFNPLPHSALACGPRLGSPPATVCCAFGKDKYYRPATYLRVAYQRATSGTLCGSGAFSSPQGLLKGTLRRVPGMREITVHFYIAANHRRVLCERPCGDGSVNPKADKPPWNAWIKVKHADYKLIT
jgi:hypothetical protein